LVSLYAADWILKSYRLNRNVAIYFSGKTE
jgi:hypothetical protein